MKKLAKTKLDAFLFYSPEEKTTGGEIRFINQDVDEFNFSIQRWGDAGVLEWEKNLKLLTSKINNIKNSIEEIIKSPSDIPKESNVHLKKIENAFYKCLDKKTKNKSKQTTPSSTAETESKWLEFLKNVLLKKFELLLNSWENITLESEKIKTSIFAEMMTEVTYSKKVNELNFETTETEFINGWWSYQGIFKTEKEITELKPGNLFFEYSHKDHLQYEQKLAEKKHLLSKEDTLFFDLHAHEFEDDDDGEMEDLAEEYNFENEAKKLCWNRNSTTEFNLIELIQLKLA